jgi:hypothetical protein
VLGAAVGRLRREGSTGVWRCIEVVLGKLELWKPIRVVLARWGLWKPIARLEKCKFRVALVCIVSDCERRMEVVSSGRQ